MTKAIQMTVYLIDSVGFNVIINVRNCNNRHYFDWGTNEKSILYQPNNPKFDSCHINILMMFFFTSYLYVRGKQGRLHYVYRKLDWPKDCSSISIIIIHLFFFSCTFATV